MPDSINQILCEIIKLGDTPIHDAIIGLIFTAGLKESIFREFKINDFIKACDDYFEDNEPHDIVTLIAKDPNQIFCCWEVKNGSYYQVTFSTPETTSYIFNYLKQTFDIENLDGEEFLFQNKSSDEFRQIRNAYASDMIGHKRNAYNRRFNNDIRLTVKGIIAKFKYICNQYLEVGEDKSFLVDLFVGNATEDNKFYQLYKEDKNSIFQYYKQICPYLIINDDFNPSVIEDNANETSNPIEHDFNNLFNEYYTNIVSEIPNDYDKYYFIRGQVKDYLDNNNLMTTLDENKIRYLFKCAEIDFIIKNENYSIFCPMDELDDEINELFTKLERLGLHKIVGEEFHFVFKSYFEEYIQGSLYDTYEERIIATFEGIKAAMHHAVHECCYGEI